MCGIVGAVGTEPVLPVLLDGLARLEYRGYDSAGVALDAGGSLWRVRRSGRLDALVAATGSAPPSLSGVGHTRWATHGPPTERNAHPHLDCTGTIAIVHNGIVENHAALRSALEEKGHAFASETDSEVVAHLVEESRSGGLPLGLALAQVLAAVEGACAVAVTSASDPDLVVAGRKGSPLVVGVTPRSGLVASDVPALLPHASELYAVAEGQVVEIRAGAIRAVSGPRELRPERRGMGWSVDTTELGAYPDHMLKEIHEQPAAIAATLGGRRAEDRRSPGRPSGVDLAGVERVLVTGCGTSLHAGLATRAAFETWADLPVECEVASELRYRRRLPVDERTLVVGISQSGETADTLGAFRRVLDSGARGLALTNVAGSAMAREATAVRYTRAGPEIGVAATKTHVTQLVALQQLALGLARARSTLPVAELDALHDELASVPEHIAKVLAAAGDVADVAGRHAAARDVFYIGRGTGHAVALEGALKLKEIAYVRAEAYAAGELKHGPIALIEPGVVVVAVVDPGSLRGKVLSNVAEVRARGATVIALAAEGDGEAAAAADDVLWVPRLPHAAELLYPAVQAVVLQLLAYHVAKGRGLDVDKPRNLAKTVTVE